MTEYLTADLEPRLIRYGVSKYIQVLNPSGCRARRIFGLTSLSPVSQSPTQRRGDRRSTPGRWNRGTDFRPVYWGLYDSISPTYLDAADKVDRYGDMEAAYKDQVYLEQIRPDELKFIDIDNIVFSIGKDLKIIDDGKDVFPSETGYECYER